MLKVIVLKTAQHKQFWTYQKPALVKEFTCAAVFFLKPHLREPNLSHAHQIKFKRCQHTSTVLFPSLDIMPLQSSAVVVMGVKLKNRPAGGSAHKFNVALKIFEVLTHVIYSSFGWTKQIIATRSMKIQHNAS